jgi:uncharacterized membrane protein YbaN (DUF454 family)
VWIPIGLVCVGIGGIGVVVPGLPSTGFFVLAAAAFARSSPRLEAWLLDLPGVGPLVRDYRAGLGMPRSAKVTAITMMLTAVTISAVVVDPVWLKAVIVAAGAVGTVVVLRVPTKQPAAPSSGRPPGEHAGPAPDSTV